VEINAATAVRVEDLWQNVLNIPHRLESKMLLSQ